MSFFEIYNEQIKDLLNNEDNDNLMIIEDPKKGMLIPDLINFEVKELKEIEEFINKGNFKRKKASTIINNNSSRSHAIIQFNLDGKLKENEKNFNSKIFLIDLAGSEKASYLKENSSNKREVENSNINKSLLALGNCINLLSDEVNYSIFLSLFLDYLN